MGSRARLSPRSRHCDHSQVGIAWATSATSSIAVDVASDKVETPQEVAATIRTALKYVPRKHLIACTNCGMAPMRREIAIAKLKALAAGAALARKRR